MPEITSRLSTALADRYKIERHLGEGGTGSPAPEGKAHPCPAPADQPTDHPRIGRSARQAWACCSRSMGINGSAHQGQSILSEEHGHPIGQPLAGMACCPRSMGI